MIYIIVRRTLCVINVKKIEELFGRVAEWFIAEVLKTSGRDERPVGSNPASSASI